MKRFGWFGSLVAAIAMIAHPVAPARADLLSTIVQLVPPMLLASQQPYPPGDGYIWEPGYWSWNQMLGNYYWVPGEWVQPPQVGYDWTPGYWADTGNGYGWYPGYWATQVGYYGGINYGNGYYGNGYVGGRWYGRTYRYNRAVTRVDVHIRNVYEDRTVVVNHFDRVAYTGGNGVHSHPTAWQQNFARQRHVGMTSSQQQHAVAASRDPGLRWNGSRSQPQVRQPQTRQPQVRQPQVRQPQVRQPQTRQPQTRQPQVRQPQVRQPQVRQPQVRQPQVRQPHVRQPQVRQPQVRQPQVRQPQVRQPQVRQPQVRQPQPQRAPAQHTQAKPQPQHSHGPQ
jgi:hypothetical protein